MGATSRRDTWFATAGISVGLSTTLVAGAFGLGERRESWMTFALVALVAVFPTLLSASERLSAASSAARTGALSFGVAVPTLFVLVSTGSDSRSTPQTCALWLLGSFVAATFVAVAYGPLLIAAGHLARGASERPAGSVGGGRWLLVLVAAIAALASWATVCVRHGGGYALWRELLVFDAVLAALCAAVSLRDGLWAGRLGAVLAGRAPTLCFVGVTCASASVPALATSPCPRPVHGSALARVAPVDGGAYRSAKAPVPLFVLDGPPDRAAAALRRSAFLSFALAVALGGAAARTPAIAHQPPIPPFPEIARVPVPDQATGATKPGERAERRYAP